MSDATDRQYFLGWDVGGWNCDKNPKSRDALVILNETREILGTPWRGNLRKVINTAHSSREFLKQVFALCQSSLPASSIDAIMAIDAPLGFSEEFRRLMARSGHVPVIEDSASNSYLFRQTDKILFKKGYSPLSPVKDMLGSQATKGMHFLSKFAPVIAQCGVWTDGQLLTAIEAYPATCRTSGRVQAIRQAQDALGHPDLEDAYVCAIIACLFRQAPQTLRTPPSHIPPEEGWIWTTV